MNGDLLVVVFHSLHLDSPSTANAPLFIRLSRNSSAQRVLEGDAKGCSDKNPYPGTFEYYELRKNR